MSHWEATGKSNDWYTPTYIFEALGCNFDCDVAGPAFGIGCHVPADSFIAERSLERKWEGFVWLNPPFGGRGGLDPWLAKFFAHDNGIALTPDRTSAPWFQKWAPHAISILFLPKVRFLRPDGTEGRSPSNGTALMAAGMKGHAALMRAHRIGFLVAPRVAPERIQAPAESSKGHTTLAGETAVLAVPLSTVGDGDVRHLLAPAAATPGEGA